MSVDMLLELPGEYGDKKKSLHTSNVGAKRSPFATV